MFITDEYVKARFREYNQLFFDGNLPLIPIQIERRKRSWASFCFNTKSASSETAYCYLAFNSMRELLSENWNDVIIHEMIHYYIWFWELKGSPHGKVFKSIMKEINSKYGRNIGIKYDGPYIKTEIRGNEHYATSNNYCVASFKEPGGMMSIKRISFETELRNRFLRFALENNGRTTVQLIVSNNPYFGNLPITDGIRTIPVRSDALMKRVLNRRYVTKVYELDIRSELEQCIELGRSGTVVNV